MSNYNIQVKGYKETYPNLNKKLYEEDRRVYDGALIGVYITELHSGFKVKRANKANRQGTTITCRAISNDDEYIKQVKEIDEMIDQFNNKYTQKLNHLSDYLEKVNNNE